MCHPPKQHSAKKSSLPVVEETNPVILPQDSTNEPFLPEQDDSPTRFSIHNNEYESESDVEPQVTNPKTTGEDDSMVSAEDMPAEVAVPSLPSWMPHQNMSAAPSNDMLAAVIARVTKETIESLANTNPTLKDIEEAATAAAIESIRKLSAPTKEVPQTMKQPAARAKKHLPAEQTMKQPAASAKKHVPADQSVSSSEYSYSSEDDDPSKRKKPRTVRVLKKCRVAPDTMILVVNGHTGNDTRRPLTELGESTRSVMKHVFSKK